MSQFTDTIDSLKLEIAKKEAALKTAEKNKKDSIKSKEKEIKRLKNNASKKLSSFEGITLYADRITYKNQTLTLSNESSARVETSGSVYTESKAKSSTGVSVPGAIVGGAIAGPVGAVVAGKKNKVDITTDVHDNRTLFLEVSCSDGSFSAEYKPEKEKALRLFAAEINTAAASADTLRQSTEEEVLRLEEELSRVKSDNEAINQLHIELTNAQKRLEDFKSTASEDQLKELEDLEKERGKKAIKTLLIIIAAAAIALLLGLAMCSRSGANGESTEATQSETLIVSSSAMSAETPSSVTMGQNSSGIEPSKEVEQDLMSLAIGDTAILKDCKTTIQSVKSEDGTLSIEYVIEANKTYSFNPGYIVAANDENKTVTPRDTEGMQSLNKGDVYTGMQNYKDDGSLTKLVWIGSFDNDAEWHFDIERTKSPIMEVLDGISNTPAEDVYGSLLEQGMTIDFKHAITGMDFTEEVIFAMDNPEDETSLPWLITGYENLDLNGKKVTLLIDTQENMDRIAQEQATKTVLENKLDSISAWQAAADYGDREYPYGFKLHYLMEKYAETAEDENTWFLKAGCTVTNEFNAKGKFTCEARVTGTDDSPEVIYFIVY